jgi:hypothetical protein
MLSPASNSNSKRIISPSKQLSSSPRGNHHGRNNNFSGADMLTAGFLRYFKWLLAGVIGIAFVRIVTTEDPYNLVQLEVVGSSSGSNHNYSYSYHDYEKLRDSGSPMTVRIASSPDTSSSSNRNGDGDGDGENKNNENENENDSTDESKTDKDPQTTMTGNYNMQVSTKEPQEQKYNETIDGNTSGGSDTTMNEIEIDNAKNVSYDHQSSKDDKPTRIKNDDRGETITKTTTNNESSKSSGKSGDLMSFYNASNDPVILDGWNRTVQVHLIVDVTSSPVDVNPASKLLLSAVARSEYTQLSAVTFVRPSIETLEMFPRRPDLPLLFLIDWGSIDRDCHRLQLVLENLRSEKQLVLENLKQLISKKNKTTTSQLLAEKEEPYFLLVDSSGSTRQTGCNYLFQSSSIADTGDDGNDNGNEKTIASYAHTNDMKRIRLAKRSIVRNRYYDRTTKEIHVGELSPNQWDDTPSNYDRPVLHSPFPLRESFVMGIHNITGGKPVVNEDSKRNIDVGYFWKSGDYSHYGFYRRDIAKVVKTLHHSTLEKKAGSRMENAVGIVYTDVKGMEAGQVQFDYIEQILACKIVVITQRDEWEDHYRLMESLASGALVMTDSMVALPEGLVDKVNIVVYDSPNMLKELIRYYLKPEHKNKRKRIASKGYNLVMGRHRDWHRLETLLFGRPLTYVDRPDGRAPPKEIPPSFS